MWMRCDQHVICMSIYRKLSCSMPCLHLEKWTTKFEPLASEGSKMFSVTLIQIREKKSPQLKFPGKNTFNIKNDFPQSELVETYPRGSCSSFLLISTPFLLCHLFLIQLGKLIKHILYIPPSPQSQHPSCIPNLTNSQWNHLQGFKSVTTFMKGGSGSSLN